MARLEALRGGLSDSDDDVVLEVLDLRDWPVQPARAAVAPARSNSSADLSCDPIVSNELASTSCALVVRTGAAEVPLAGPALLLI